MPPTIQSGKHGDRAKSRSTVPKRSDIICRIKYLNQLPDIPFDPKFIKYPFDGNRFVDYNATSLERNYKHELLAEHDLGVTIDLINPDTYKIDPNAVLDPKDERLLEEELATPGDSKRSQRHKRSVSWLRKTEYISSEYSRSQPNSEKPETKVAYTLKKKFNEEEIYQDRSNQITAIQKTFEDAKKPIEKHYSKPFVTPVEILPVFPDFETWIHPCAQVNFDSDPSLRGKSSHEQVDEMSQAMIRGMVDESDEQFVGYFLPSEGTMGKRKRDFEEEVDYREDEEYEYKLTREYNWNVKNKASKGYEENYFFLFRKGKGVFFNELETRVRLSKRRVKEGLSSNSVLVVKHRELSEQELAVQEARLSQLENILPEDEEEADEEAGQGSGEENEGGEEDQEAAAGSGEEASGDEGKASGDSDKDEDNEEHAEQEGSEAGEQAGSEAGEQAGSEAGEQASDGEQEGSDQGEQATSDRGEQESGDEAKEGEEENGMEHDGEQEDRGSDGGEQAAEHGSGSEGEREQQQDGDDSDRGSIEGGDGHEEASSDRGEQEDGDKEESGGEEQEEGSGGEQESGDDREAKEGGSDEEEEMEHDGDEEEDHRKEDEQEIFGGDSDEESVASA